MMDTPIGIAALFVIIISYVTIAFGGNLTKVVPFDEEDEPDEAMIDIRRGPSEFDIVVSGSGLGQIIPTNEKTKLGTLAGASCPSSCFCEEEENYATCIGDGVWNPPLLPSFLKRLEMRSFYLPELTSSSIHLPGLLELQLQQCNLSRLNQDVFLNLEQLDRLDLSQNHLEGLDSNTFRGLSSLRHLDLSSNLLNNLSRPFIHLIALEHLNLRNNKLRKLDADSFEGLKKVQYVNLDGNMIDTVDVAAFQHLASMAHLILSNNPLSNLARLNFFGSRLQYIDISNIGIKRVPQALTQFVRDLRLAKNEVKEIHRGDLDSYPYLGLLVLDDNNLEVLEEDALGRHEYLARLWLNGNKLKTIPQSLPISLKALYIEENQISALKDEDFEGLIYLEQIFMQRNQITKISKFAFKDLIGLRTLDLQANNLTNISETIFSNLTKLESLDLSQNPILALSATAFKGLDNVRVLQISRIHTNISISENILSPLKALQILEMYGSPRLVEIVMNSTRLLHSLRGVRELNLMHNELTTLRKDFFTFFPKMTLIKLSGNSWNCSDEDYVNLMKHWMKSSPINFYRSFSIRCDTPQSLGLKPILLLDNNDFSQNLDSNVTSQPPQSSPLLTTKTISDGYKNSSLTSSSIALSEDDVNNVLSNASSLFNSFSLQIEPNSFTIPAVNVTAALLSTNDNLSSTTEFVHPLPPYADTEEEDEFLYTNEDDSLYLDATHIQVISNLTASTILENKVLEPNNVNASVVLNATETTKTPNSSISTIPQPLWEIHNRRPELQIKWPITTTASDFIGSSSTTTTTSKPTMESTNYETMKVLMTEKLIKTFNKRPNVSRNVHSQSPYSKDLWLYRGDGSHTYVEHRGGVSIHSLQKHDNSLVIGAGVASAAVGIALIVVGFVIARRISAKHRRLRGWENSRSSYWNGRESEEGEFISEGVIVGIGSTGTGILRETEGTVGVLTESHHGLNNRLYLLLQRDSSTGITPETLPDPREVPSLTNCSLNSGSTSRLFM